MNTINLKINDIVKDKINPILSRHNGFILINSIEDTVPITIIIDFYGACSDCYFQYNSTLNLIKKILEEELGQNIDLINSSEL